MNGQPHGLQAPVRTRRATRTRRQWRHRSLLALAATMLVTCAAPPEPASVAHQHGTPPTAGPSAAPALPSSAAPPAAAAATTAPAVTPEGDRHAVAAENDSAAQIAMAVLARGGNAADAAVAGVLAAGVAAPVSSGIGGGGFALYWAAAERQVTVLDFRESAPGDLRQADYDRRPPAPSRRGVMVGVPGEIAGLVEMHRRWGKVPFAELVGRAADLAETGFPISPHMGRSLRWNRGWLTPSPRYAPVFAPGGTLLATGAVAKNAALASTLRRIATEGRAGFYEGSIAQDIVATAQAAGSRITEEDLKRYRVVERSPLHLRWEGHEIYTMPPPSAGGLLLAQTLIMHRSQDLRSLGAGSGAYLHLLAETFRGAIADRIRAIGDPAFVEMNVANLFAAERMRLRRGRIALDKSQDAPSFPLREAGTSHFVAVDAQGNVACVTTTVNNMFGAKLITAGGFPLNDELDDFSTRALEQRFGAPRRPNRPRPGARPVSSMTPTIVVRDGKAVLALGGSGGTRIPTSVTQVLLSQLVFGHSLAPAVAAPRIHTPPGGGLWLEPATAEPLKADLRSRGEALLERHNYSSVTGIAMTHRVGGRQLTAVGDPHKGGSGRVFGRVEAD